MKSTDTIADMFTRIRNALQARHDVVSIPHSKLKEAITNLLKEQGFVKKYKIVTDPKSESKKEISIELKYNEYGRPLINEIKRISRPGKRVYVEKSEVPKVLNGFGISILSTSKGVLDGRAARLGNVGGELIGIVH